jgi:hypothetical protein
MFAAVEGGLYLYTDIVFSPQNGLGGRKCVGFLKDT